MRAKVQNIQGSHIVPRITLENQLTSSKRDFSILSASRATIDELRVQWTVFKDKGIDFRNIVPLDPSRVILHELAAEMQCYIKQELDPSKGEEQFKEMVLKDYDELKKSDEYSKVIEKMNKDYEELHKSVISYIENSQNPGILTKEEQKLVNELLEKVKGDKDALNESNKNGAIEGIRSILYMERARNHGNKLAHSFVEKSSHDKLTVLQNKKDSIAIFTIGGPASGKTSSLVKISKAIKAEYDVAWNDIAHHNLDRARTILFEPKPEEPFLYGSCTSDEARLVKERELKLMASLPHVAQGYRHQLYDGSEIDAKAFKQHAVNGKSTIVCLVSTDFVAALQRAYLRGKSEHRYVPIDSLIQAHKNGPESLIKALNQDGIGQTNTTVFMYDNNVERGKDSILFGTINVQEKEIIIHDKEKLQSWINKSNLNTKLNFPKEYKPDEIYSFELYSGKEKSMEEYFQPLIECGYSIKETPAPEITPNSINLNS